MSLKISKIRLPLAAKAVILIAALVLMSGIANWFCLKRIDVLDRLSGVLDQQVSPARLALTEAKTRIESFGLATYKMYATADADQLNEVAGSVKGEYDAARNSLKNVLGYFPKSAEDIDLINGKLDLAHGIAMEVRALIVANERSKARDMLDIRFDPARDDVSFQINRLVNILGGDARDMLDEAAETKAWTLNMTIFTLAGGSVATLIVALLLAHFSVARPLHKLAAKMVGIAQGDFATEIEGTGRGDEVGAMARAVAVFKRNGLALRKLQAQQQSDSERAEAEKRASLAALADSFEREVLSVADAVVDAANELEQFARSMQKVAEESGQRAQTATAAAAATTEGATTVAAAVEEMSTTIGDINRQVVEAANVVGEAAGRADAAVTNSQGLSTAVQHIDRVVGLITTIAGHTNLLALNATIEAARAGEAGRGFAVVAQEVKSLAGQTTRALAEISEKTASVRQASESVGTAIHDISRVVTQISSISMAIAHSVEQQSIASQKISKNVEDAAERTRGVSSTIADVSEFAGQTGEVAEHIQVSAENLNRQASFLHRRAQDFASRVRAG
ncbi:MAG TPA: methyl-accepting chemotaxis protein [Pseudolabrys sp.]